MSANRVEITEPNGPKGHAISYNGRTFYHGDVATVDADTQKHFVEVMGWAKDPDGALKQAQRSTAPKVVNLDDQKLSNAQP